MKDRHREWLKLGVDKKPAAQSKNAPSLLVMRRLQVIQDLERLILLHSDGRGRLVPGIEDDFSRKLFGIIRDDTLAHEPERDPVTDEEYDRYLAYWEFEEQFSTREATDDEAVSLLLSLGFDFRDDRGFPLRCTTLLSRQAEAAAKGICGARMPDRAEAEVQHFASSLERDAEAFLRQKRSDGRQRR